MKLSQFYNIVIIFLWEIARHSWIFTCLVNISPIYRRILYSTKVISQLSDAGGNYHPLGPGERWMSSTFVKILSPNFECRKIVTDERPDARPDPTSYFLEWLIFFHSILLYFISIPWQLIKTKSKSKFQRLQAHLSIKHELRGPHVSHKACYWFWWMTLRS